MYDHFTKELTTKFGIDRLRLMLFFMPLLEANSSKKADRTLNRLKSFLVQQIKRGITAKENLDLLQGCYEWVKSDAQTNERLKAMDYLFDLEFLSDGKEKN